MEALRKYMWLWVILVVLLVSFFIILIFICLNSWIRRQGKLVLEPSRALVSETYSKPARRQTPALQTPTPPLPPRTQFTTQVPESPSYENLAEEPGQTSVKIPEAEGPYEVPEAEPGLGRESQPDYLEVEGGPEPAADEDDEDYDDIDAEDEDYDDVG